MKIIQEPLKFSASTYDLSGIGPLYDILFLDIETTGFHAKTACLYMIGALYFEDNVWKLCQFLAEEESEEIDVLNEFLKLCDSRHILIHYNGNTFDLPFLKQKCLQYEIEHPFSEMQGIDLYQRISPFKKQLSLENCKQKTIEQFLELDREDLYHAGQLINVYKEYTQTHDSQDEAPLLLHNKNDLEGMFSLLPMLTYMDILMVPFRVVKVQANHYVDLNNEKCHEILMKIRFTCPFPKSISINANGSYFCGENTEGFLKVPLSVCEMKYFYSNYSDYYYLPKEDTALHKSVSSFVDKQYREQAKASNCYTKKEGRYLPQWDTLFTPVFKKTFKDKQLYFELTEELKKSPSEFTKYALHVMDMLIHS